MVVPSTFDTDSFEKEEEDHHRETHLAHQCETMVMFTTTAGESIGEAQGEDLIDALESGSISLIELESSAKMKGDDNEIDAKLDCQCDSYKCQCRKQCFCQLQEAQYGGNIVPAESDSDASDPKGSGIVDSEFKCTCAFESAPGSGALAGGTMDCDCKIADCACEKQCDCKMRKTLD